MSEKKDKMIKGLKKYAEIKGIALNPNKEQLELVFDKLFKNLEDHGLQYCPCRARLGAAKEDAKIICPCIYHLDEIKDQGNCLCRLYFKK